MSGDPLVLALKPYSTCDVADALLKLGHRHGGFLSGITMWSPKRQEGSTKIIGQVYTVKYDSKHSGSIQSASHYIDTVPAGYILFISVGDLETVNALYGGLMTNRAKTCDAAGTIVDGRIRDLQEHRDLDFPVFAKDVGITAPHESLIVSEINKPLEFKNELQKVTINPSDYLMADLNGVVHIPRDLAEKVVALIPSQVEADERIAKDLEAGRLFAEASKEHRAYVKTAKDV